MGLKYEEFINKLKLSKNKDRATVVYLKGDLGSGKTTFTKNLCKYLGLDIEITSPTFTILKVYDFEVFDFKKLIHIDTYRLNSYDDLLKIRFDEYLNDKENLIFIEWPELIGDSFKPDVFLSFEYGEGDCRNIFLV